MEFSKEGEVGRLSSGAKTADLFSGRIKAAAIEDLQES